MVDGLQRPHALMVRLAFHRTAEVLDRDRHTGERRVMVIRVHPRSLCSRRVEPLVDQRVDLRIDSLGGVDGSGHHLLGRDCAGADQLRLPGHVEIEIRVPMTRP
jgi:hypothetical protein